MTKPTPKIEELKIRLNGNIYWLKILLSIKGNIEIEKVDTGDGEATIDLVEIIDDLTEIEEDL